MSANRTNRADNTSVSHRRGRFLRVFAVLSVLGLALLLVGSFIANAAQAVAESNPAPENPETLALVESAGVHPDAAECYGDLPGDADCDCRVTMGDVGALAASWRTVVPGIADGGVHVSHIVEAASQLGKRCLPAAVQILNEDADTLAAARAMGANYARIGVRWEQVEPIQGQRDWSSYDSLIQRVTSAGLHPLVEVRGFPEWARKPEDPWQSINCGLMADSQYVAGPSSGWWSFVRDLVERSDGDGDGDLAGLGRPVRLWEIGNEPESKKRDGTHFGMCYGPIMDPNDPKNLDKADYTPARKYAELMRVSTDAIHTADPYGLSAFGGMMYMVIPPWSLDSPRWLDEVLGVSQPTDFDIMNIHSYLAINCGKTMGDRAGQVRQQMANHGIDKPVMVTEAGVASWWRDGSSQEVDVCGAPTNEQRQAAYVPQLYAESMAADLFSTFWFTQRDVWDWQNPPANSAGYGLLRIDFSEKPGYLAYQTWVNQMKGTTFVQSLSAADIGSSDVTGYEFRTRDGRLKWVLWASSGKADATRHVTVPWPQVRVSNYLGLDSLGPGPGAGRDGEIVDGAGDDLGLAGDGVVIVEVGPSPIYIEQQ